MSGIVRLASAEDGSESSVPMPEIETADIESDQDTITSDSDITNTVDQEANNEAGVIGIENPDEQNALSDEAESSIDEDENLDAEDLRIDDPTILPDSTILYPLKNMWRGVLSIMTVDPVKKVQLKLRFANEKLIEAKKISEKTDDSTMIEKAIDNYKDELGQVQSKIASIKEMAEDNTEVDNLVGEIANNQIKHSVLFDRIEKNLSEETSEKFNAKIEIARNSIENGFSEAVLTITESEKYGEKLENTIVNQNGSNFKYFKHLEVLKRIEENMPEEAKQGIQQAQANVQIKFERDFTELSKEKQEVFQYYVQNIGGNEIRQFEVINDIENKMIPDTMRTIVEEAKGQNVIRIERRLQNPEFKEKSQQIMKHLETGTMENMRVISELENNLSSDMATQIVEIKTRTMNNFREEIKNAGNRIMNNTSNSPVSNNAGLANPAAVHCENQGGRLKSITDAQGTSSMCVFVDGSECEEWAFFRGECMDTDGADISDTDISDTTSEKPVKPIVEPTVDVPVPNNTRPDNISDNGRRPLPVETKVEQSILENTNTDSATEIQE